MDGLIDFPLVRKEARGMALKWKLFFPKLSKDRKEGAVSGKLEDTVDGWLDEVGSNYYEVVK